MTLTKYLTFLRFKFPYYVAIDISATALKCVVFGNQRNARIPIHASFTSLPQGVVIGTEIRDINVLSTLLREAISEISPQPIYCAFNIWGNGIIWRQFSVEGVPDKTEIEATIQKEMSVCVPYPKDKILSDFDSLLIQKGDLEFTEILLIAVFSLQIMEWSSLVRSINLTPVTIKPEGIALSTYLDVFEAPTPNQLKAGLHVNATHSTFILQKHNGQPLFKELDAGFQCSEPTVKSAIDHIQVHTNTTVKPIVQQVITLIQEAKSFIETDNDIVLYLSGPSAFLVELELAFNTAEQKTQFVLPVTEWFGANANVEIDDEWKHSFSIALGMSAETGDLCKI